MTNSRLPQGFETLEPFVDGWAIAGAQNRADRRTVSSEQERTTFYAAAKDLLVPALSYLDQRPLKQFDDQEQRLMNLMLSFAHVAQAVEVQAEQEGAHAQLRRYLEITRATADA